MQFMAVRCLLIITLKIMLTFLNIKLIIRKDFNIYSVPLPNSSISCLVGKSDYLLIDRADHASIVDGCRLSFGKTLKFIHNDPADLERVLAGLNNGGGRLIIVDGVFSMEGDIARLPEIIKLAQKHHVEMPITESIYSIIQKQKTVKEAIADLMTRELKAE